jgi:asparagine synthase (glutamine-hydrolysing)
MMVVLAHRGPDDSGVWIDSAAGVGLGHRRLSIIDPSPEGHQPMLSSDGRYVISYNGEIYNAAELRARLKEHHGFRGHSDTEVLLAAIQRWGLGHAVRQVVGMFAFALVDRDRHRLHLVRDRVGEKPLYYGIVGGDLVFASELKAFRRHSCWTGEVDRASLDLFLRHRYVPAPRSIYRGIRKVVPGTIATFRTPSVEPAETDTYWSIRQLPGARKASAIDESAAVTELESLLQQTIRQQMVADVPLGAFLSGGVDSSLIVAMMQEQSAQPVRTFTIGFEDPEHDESGFAREVAQHLGTHHTELRVTPAEALQVVPELPDLYDEPFADPSQIPTLLVARLARRQVTVALSGDGGDELFGGYDRYRYVRRAWPWLRRVPSGIRRAAAGMLLAVPVRAWERGLAAVPRLGRDRIA